MSKAYVGYTNKKGFIKTVFVENDGSIDLLGIELHEFFKDISHVKDIVITTVDRIEDGEVYFFDDIEELRECDYEYCEYDSLKDLQEDMDSDTYYYLYQDDKWIVCKPEGEFKDLEQLLEEEY